jgi:hypothetical protein
MKSKTKKIILAVAVIGVVAAGGVAFTAANSVENSIAGYGTSTVTGAVADDVAHTLSGDGTHIVSTAIHFTTDQSANNVQVSFGVTGTPEATLMDVCDETGGQDVVCTYVAPGVDTHDSTDFNVAVTGPSS